MLVLVSIAPLASRPRNCKFLSSALTTHTHTQLVLLGYLRSEIIGAASDSLYRAAIRLSTAGVSPLAFNERQPPRIPAAANRKTAATLCMTSRSAAVRHVGSVRDTSLRRFDFRRCSVVMIAANYSRALSDIVPVADRMRALRVGVLRRASVLNWLSDDYPVTVY